MIGRILDGGPRTGLRGILYRLNRRRIELQLVRAPFYQLHPYIGHSPLKAVDWHTVVDRELGIFYHRIPKVANSSLVASVEHLKQQKVLANDQSGKRELRVDLVHPSQLSRTQSAETANLLKFVFVRNPYTRVLSAYLSKVQGKLRAGERVNLRPGKSGNADLPENPSFEQFCRFLQEGGLYANGHWTPQTDFLTFPVARYDFIGHFESLDADFNALARKISKGDAGAQFSKEDPGHATGASRKQDEYYTRALYDLIYELYRADFDAFGYARA